MRIEIPELSVVALIGASSGGKSYFAKQHFKQTEVLSSDHIRALISDDENNLAVNAQTFETLYYIAGQRLNLGLLTVIDATNVQKASRASVLKLAKEQNCHAAAIVLDVPETVCLERNRNRPDRDIPDKVISRQCEELRRSVKSLHKEGFRFVYVVKHDETADVEITRVPMWSNKKNETGPFDIIGDVHGCYSELCSLLNKLGYAVDKSNHGAIPPANRRAVFTGDLCDRGPDSAGVLRLAMNMVRSGHAFCVPGNHDVKLLKKLRGADVQMTHGLDITVAQLADESDDFISNVKSFLDGLVSHYVFDNGNLVVSHAGLIEKYQGRGSARVREFCLYGETTGETDDYGLPVRLPWAGNYRGKAAVVYGHTAAVETVSVNNTYCIDTGCVFGGKLTAFRYPEKVTVSADAEKEHYTPVKPFAKTCADDGGLLNIDDVTGPKHITTRLRRGIKLSAENSAAALEAMSRFAADPRWLIYLPPTMSPCATSSLPDYLEHPAEAFDYYKARGIGTVVCERKHMGSRAVIVICKDAETAARRFNVKDGTSGIIYTRSGRHFFDDDKTGETFLLRLGDVLTESGFWKAFNTGWVCLDAEIMPWSAKARKLLEEQYAPAGRAGRSGLSAAIDIIDKTKTLFDNFNDNLKNRAETGVDLDELLKRYKSRYEAINNYVKAYRGYCWDVKNADDYRVAPFHILATESGVLNDENHVWHMETIVKYIAGRDPVFMATDYVTADLLNETSVAAAVQWWEGLTESGGEGMVVKPLEFIAKKGGELLQPAVKCRGREYLRIIYGPEYMLDDNLERLKKRSLAKKRNLALNEFALGMESLERFVQNEPLYRVHECVFGVLAMESEPVDPRL